MRVMTSKSAYLKPRGVLRKCRCLYGQIDANWLLAEQTLGLGLTLALTAKGLRCSCFQTIDDLRDTKFSMLNTVLEPKDIDK
jgi:hypothetical protein